MDNSGGAEFFGYFIALVIAVVMIVAQCQLFGIKSRLQELIDLQKRGPAPETPSPQDLARAESERRICDPPLPVSIQQKTREGVGLLFTAVAVVVALILIAGFTIAYAH